MRRCDDRHLRLLSEQIAKRYTAAATARQWRLCNSWAMLLYNSAVSGNCYKVRLVAAHLGVPLELEELSVVDRSNRAEVLGDLNPARRVPTLVLDDGRPLAESNAISGTSATAPTTSRRDPYERAQVLQWQFFEQYQHEPSIAVVRFLIAFSGQAEKHADRIEEQTANGYIALDAMERHLEGRDLPRRRAVHARRHLALRLHARGARGRLRPRAVPGDPRLARPGRRAARPHHDRRLSARVRPGAAVDWPDDVRVRFAPSPTGSLHLGNALSAVANRAFADETRGSPRPPDRRHRPERTLPGGEEAILSDLDWLGIDWDEGPFRQSERAERHAEAAALALDAAAQCATRTARSGSPARRWPAPTAPRPTSSRRSPTTSTSASPTSSAAPTTGRTRRCTSGSRGRSAVSCPR